jgi:hypothetical protein
VKANVYYVTATGDVPATTGGSVYAACKSTKDVVLSGGCVAKLTNVLGQNIVGSFPVAGGGTSADRWQCEGANNTSTDFSIATTAVCIAMP